MDPKDLRSETTLGECINNGNSHYTQSTSASTQTGDRNKTYHDIGSNSLGKVGSAAGRPCAVIGPDRAIISAPQSVADEYHKRDHLSHWPLRENIYQQAPFYPQKSSNLTNPQRNISPRQTFQENMQRIMVPPTYTKMNGDHNFLLERNDSIPKIVKSNETPKYCDVPFTVNSISGDQKTSNSCDMPLPIPNVNSAYLRPQNHVWPQNSAIGSHPQPRYGSPDIYQYNDYTSCAVPSNMPYARPQRVGAEEPIPSYAEHFYRGRNIRFEPYPPAKERYPPPRYDYINRYPTSFQPPSFPSHKFEMQKLPPSYPTHLQGTYIRDPALDGYQRNSKPQISFNVPFPGQGISSKYSAVPGNSLPNKYYPYPDHNLNSSASVQGTYDQRNKLYVDYKGVPPKPYPASQNYYMNELPRHMVKGQTVPNYSSNVHPLAYYRKDVIPAKTSEFLPTFKPSDAVYYNSSSRQHSSNMRGTYDPTINNAPNHQYRPVPEDAGYATQAHGPVFRNLNPAHHPMYNNNYDPRFGPMMSSHMVKFGVKTKDGVIEEKKNIDVRQFLTSWSEGDDEGNENAINGKEIIIQTSNNFSKHCENLNSQEQLYVLGLVNVPSEELGKYEHIQKVSKLPDNIKGYTNIDLLNQFEEAIESSIGKTSEMPVSKKGNVKQRPDLPGRPVSPFDVEAKISQSVIHKDVGCNFEIRPCSPGLVSMQVALPAQPLGGERTIEKVSNPVKIEPKILMPTSNKNPNSESMAINDDLNVSSCGKANTSEVKLPYSMHDLESNSGVCLASLPRLDNDIELNFPEVNQQFINANKKECVDSVLADMTEFSENQSLSESNETCPTKDYSKLIKYRKSKCAENEPHSVPIRTDSVIKNNLAIVENISYNANQSTEPSPANDNTEKTHLYHSSETNGDALNLTVSSTIGSVMDKIETNKSEILDASAPQSDLNTAPSLGNDLTSYLLYSNNVSPINSVLADDLGDNSSKFTCTETVEKNTLNFGQVNSNDDIQDFEVSIQNQLLNKESNKEQDDIPETNDSIREYIENSTAMNDKYGDVTNTIATQLNEEMSGNVRNSNKCDDIFVSSKQSSFCEERDISTDLTKQLDSAKNQEDEDFQTDDKTRGFAEPTPGPDKIIDLTEDKIEKNVESVLILDENKHEELITSLDDEKPDKDIDKQLCGGSDSEHCSPVLQDIEKSYEKQNRFWVQRMFSPIIQNLLYNPYKNFVLYRNMDNIIENNSVNEHIMPNSVEEMSDALKLKINNEKDFVNNSSNDEDQFKENDENKTIQREKPPKSPIAALEKSDNEELASIVDIYPENKEECCISSESDETRYVDLTKESEPCAVSANCEEHEKDLNQDISISKQPPPPVTPPTLRLRALKRSLSESALSSVVDKKAQYEREPIQDQTILNLSKRKRLSEDGETHIILDNNFGRVFHINRRNSISALCEDNVSFCIMIDDNCLMTEESVFEGGTICFANIEETNIETNKNEMLDEQTKSPELENDPVEDINSYVSCAEQNEDENWVDDIACVETVVSDETEHNYNDPLSPTSYSDTGSKLDEEVIVDNRINDRKQVFYNENSCFAEALYENQSPSKSTRDVVMLANESSSEVKRNCIEELLSSSDSSLEGFDRNLIETGDSFDIFKEDVSSLIEDMTKEHIRKESYVEDVPSLLECKSPLVPDNMTSIFSSQFINKPKNNPSALSDDISNSLSSSSNYKRSSCSPEVTSTTSDDKKGILLKITKNNGARTLEVNNGDLCNNNKKIRCKFTENEDYLNSKIEVPVIRPLITKAAQKYIPPLKETIGDLKVKLRLPKDSLIKLRQLKHSNSALSKEIEKVDQKISKPNIVTKQKPKFEDVLKSIDDFQLKTSKDKTKKIKKHVPKVIIKKNENGSHYASRSNKDLFNPDLTGRKWQPWVFLEKNRFIDKMALRGKRSAVYCHRKKTYILQENFRKYRSVNKYNTEFVISKPNESFSSCPLKYTIRLKKHSSL